MTLLAFSLYVAQPCFPILSFARSWHYQQCQPHRSADISLLSKAVVRESKYYGCLLQVGDVGSLELCSVRGSLS
jgi:hypothetical protein